MRLSLFGRSLLLFVCEVLANAAVWITSGLLFGLRSEARSVLSLCLLAWTLGLRHALDADHISAIDNATRGLMALGQFPVTCGLFFSLGHSTIVIVVNIAVAISTDVYDKIGSIGDVGSVVGAIVSGTFLFLIGTANAVILWRIIKRRRMDARRAELGLAPIDDGYDNTPSIMLRFLGPVTAFVNRPWKMYPVGVLFGFGFDTASSIALLAITALAKKRPDGRGTIKQSEIIVLPLLFTCGMTLVDSIDSIIMLYSYAGFPERGWSLWEEKAALSVETVEGGPKRGPDPSDLTPTGIEDPKASGSSPSASETAQRLELPIDALPIGGIGGPSGGLPTSKASFQNPSEQVEHQHSDAEPGTRQNELRRKLISKRNTMSSLSIILTLISILVAFSISLITIMGLIGEKCASCKAAAENDPGISGKWWRGWVQASDQSGLVGAGIIGIFVCIVAVYYSFRWVKRCNMHNDKVRT
ncbi:high-affinity nickel-transport protein-domain-containing protein [Cantharellus anzutake]|uniref:high-affinity nickel-transport protein-domain-containing protein n=1 Tax=Cantharellus anzutake TaxID=1750568 RepID=UPI001908994D|nr:high-affinity nickel-transport protein-domain-containing protein [Cantharellus anzutake]KAF8324757.1 high-affinity nickel-transport protein-domain-containing protein [Cantharellus anzutake]